MWVLAARRSACTLHSPPALRRLVAWSKTAHAAAHVACSQGNSTPCGWLPLCLLPRLAPPRLRPAAGRQGGRPRGTLLAEHCAASLQHVSHARVGPAYMLSACHVCCPTSCAGVLGTGSSQQQQTGLVNALQQATGNQRWTGCAPLLCVLSMPACCFCVSRHPYCRVPVHMRTSLGVLQRCACAACVAFTQHHCSV
jgi:hypothetical protein